MTEQRLPRRDLLVALSGCGLGLASQGCLRQPDPEPQNESAGTPRATTGATDHHLGEPSSSQDAIVEVFKLGSRWKTFDPFLFCVHHLDEYPEGNTELGPSKSLAGRPLGSDFAGIDGWRMYHGRVVPGFPRHPHRGFETVTITRRGFVDHSDSLGATARYGQGDVQWMTAGSGIMHAEMFPLLNQHQPNPAELFQIWLNLPRRDKFVRPHFAMFWKDSIPERSVIDSAGRSSQVRLVAGKLADSRAPAPPPNSWASQPRSEVAIWSVKMDAGAAFELPAASVGVTRTLYFFEGKELSLGGHRITAKSGVRMGRGALTVVAGSSKAEWLLLQGRPIDEPVVQRGPFVMNTEEEIRAAYADYRSTRFGGWRFDSDDPVHSREQGRFAVHADGRKERAI